MEFFKNTFSNLFDAYKEHKDSSTGNAVRLSSPMGRSSEPIATSSPHNLKINSGDSSQRRINKRYKIRFVGGKSYGTHMQ